jgi:putative ABC transport system substrate-binding protein
MMDRRRFVLVFGTVLLAFPRVGGAQTGPNAYTLGYLGQGKAVDAHEPDAPFAVLLRNLRAMGYVEGHNLTVEARFAEGRPGALEALAAELVRAGPQVIATPSAGVAEVLLRETRTIPIVALSAGQLEAEGAVKSLAKPGGNLTGMQLHSSETIGKRLQLLREIVPGLRRVAVLRGVPFEGPGFALYRDANDAAAAKLGIHARYVQFERPEELEPLFAQMSQEQDQALIVWGNPHLNAYRRQILDLTLRYRLPAIYDVRGLREELLVYAARHDDVYREAARYVDKILKGANPGDLPIGQAKTFDLVINVATAKALGITIPESLLLRADEVIE